MNAWGRLRELMAAGMHTVHLSAQQNKWTCRIDLLRMIVATGHGSSSSAAVKAAVKALDAKPPTAGKGGGT